MIYQIPQMMLRVLIAILQIGLQAVVQIPYQHGLNARIGCIKCSQAPYNQGLCWIVIRVVFSYPPHASHIVEEIACMACH